jgi:hypothetical protein
MVIVMYQAYEEDRECWSIRSVERPAEHWQTWADNDCTADIERQRVYWISEGHCGRFARSLEPPSGCAVDDPTGWFSYCDPSIHCCATAQPDEFGTAPGVTPCNNPSTYEP